MFDLRKSSFFLKNCAESAACSSCRPQSPLRTPALYDNIDSRSYSPWLVNSWLIDTIVQRIRWCLVEVDSKNQCIPFFGYFLMFFFPKMEFNNSNRIQFLLIFLTTLIIHIRLQQETESTQYIVALYCIVSSVLNICSTSHNNMQNVLLPLCFVVWFDILSRNCSVLSI